MVIPEAIDFLVVTPLADEQAAVDAALRAAGASAADPDQTGYSDDKALNAKLYSVPRTNRQLRLASVVVISLKEAGRVPAAVAVRAALQHWYPRCVLVVGIAGASPDARLKTGDVVVPAKVVDYERETVKEGSEPKWDSFTIPKTLRREVSGVVPASSTIVGDLLRSSGRVDAPKVVTDGVTLTGDKKIRDTATLIRLARPWVEAHSVEMEAGGVALACGWVDERPIPYLVIRGIFDIVVEGGEPDKDPGATPRRLACAAAAAVAVEYIRCAESPFVQETPKSLPSHAQPPRGVILGTCDRLFSKGYPVVLFGKSDDYVQLAVKVSAAATGLVLWVKNGTPLDWTGRPSSDGSWLDWFDEVFQRIGCQKQRLVVFRDEAEVTAYAEHRQALYEAARNGKDPVGLQRRIADFERSCGGAVRFTRLDRLPISGGDVGSLDGLDIGYASWAKDFETQGYCFCSRFLSRQLTATKDKKKAASSSLVFSPIWFFDASRVGDWESSLKQASLMTWQALQFFRSVVQPVTAAIKWEQQFRAAHDLDWLVDDPQQLLVGSRSGGGVT